MTKDQLHIVAASEIAAVIDLAMQSTNDSVRSFGALLVARLAEVLDENTPLYIWTPEELEAYYELGKVLIEREKL